MTQTEQHEGRWTWSKFSPVGEEKDLFLLHRDRQRVGTLDADWPILNEIVRACNSHEKLVKALQAYRAALLFKPAGPTMGEADALAHSALAEATKGE